GGDGLRVALDALCASASRAVAGGATILVLSDRGVGAEHVAIPSLLATAAVHHHLIREGARMRVGLVVESGEPREVQHFCLLLGYGASAVNPYLAFEIIHNQYQQELLRRIDARSAIKNYIKACDKGLLKVLSKTGI